MKCIACDNKLPTKRGFANDKGRKGKLACQLPGCPTHGINYRSKEFKIRVMGWTEEEVSEYWKDRGQKPVATMRANGWYDDPANNPFSKEYWIKQGLSEAAAIVKVNSRAGKTANTKREAGFYDDPANNPYSYEFGIKQGLTPEEAQARINSKNHNCPEYWVKRGSTEEEAIELARKSANTASAQKTGRRNLSSKQADQLFSRLYKFIRRLGYTRGDVQCELNRGELVIRYDGGFYCYDFVIHPLKIIIEFNGYHVHPNPDMSVCKWDEWMHLYSKKSADEVSARDAHKLGLAEQAGYKTLVVWSNCKTNYEIATNFIKEIHNGNQSNEA